MSEQTPNTEGSFRKSPMVEVQEDDAIAEAINLTQVSVGKVQADLVRMSSSSAEQVIADEVEIRQGMVGRVNAQKVVLSQGGIALAQTSTLNFSKGIGVGVVQASDITLTNGSLGASYSQTAKLSDSQAGLMVARQVQGDGPMRTVVLLAGQVEGPVETVLDTPRAMLGGLVAGVTVGLVLFITRLLTGRMR